MATTLTTSGACFLKAGKYMSEVLSGSAVIGRTDYIVDEWINQAEDSINDETRYDWVTNYNSLTTNTKQILDDIASSKVAIQIVNYDSSGWPLTRQAETSMDINNDIVNKGLKTLKEDKVKTFMGAT